MTYTSTALEKSMADLLQTAYIASLAPLVFLIFAYVFLCFPFFRLINISWRPPWFPFGILAMPAHDPLFLQFGPSPLAKIAKDPSEAALLSCEVAD